MVTIQLSVQGSFKPLKVSVIFIFAKIESDEHLLVNNTEYFIITIM